MTPRERLLAALNHETPDRVPYFEYGISRDVVTEAFGHCPEDPLEFNRLVGRVDLEVWRKPRGFARYEKTPDGRSHLVEGLIRTRQDYRDHFQLPDPADAQAIDAAARSVAQKGEFALGLVISLSADPVFLSMGFDGVAYALADDPALVGEMLDRYSDWTVEVLSLYQKLDFDFVLCGDDVAHKTGPFVSPQVFHDVFWPRMKRVADAISLPWIQHCDGDLMPIMDDWLALGMNAIHPIEPGAMDIFQLKDRFGDRLCLCGNFDINILCMGTPEETRDEVRTKIEALSPGGGYVAASSTSIPSYVNAENFRAMVEAIREFG
ncbi:MAG: uroporphyrinogen decarboxylase family protein [Planctomycetota bacterium]|jgi:uroporphyrinogen decarboxylase|nr:uroporphyrinogen decarboxylase family protein [Planctomycetota bacterium]